MAERLSATDSKAALTTLVISAANEATKKLVSVAQRLPADSYQQHAELRIQGQATGNKCHYAKFCCGVTNKSGTQRSLA